MNIIVCIKQISDPEAPPSSFKVDQVTQKVITIAGTASVISPFDEYAIEAALRIKEQKGGKVTAVSMGVKLQRDVVKKAISMGVDELVLLEDPAFADVDSWSTAYVLSEAIKKIGKYDLILCGRQAADWDAGQVGSGVAEFLSLPCVTIARKIEIVDNKVRIEKVITDGYELIEMSLPGVITLGNEHPAPRYPSIKGIMNAKKKEPLVWKPADLGIDISILGMGNRHLKLKKLYQPVLNTQCEIISADTAEESGVKLAEKLREAKVI